MLWPVEKAATSVGMLHKWYLLVKQKLVLFRSVVVKPLKLGSHFSLSRKFFFDALIPANALGALLASTAFLLID